MPNVNDAITLSESFDVEAVVDISVSDAISLSEYNDNIAGNARGVIASDVVKASESFTGHIPTLFITESDTVSVGEWPRFDIPIIPSDLALLRGQSISELYLSVWQPTTLWSARVNNGSIAREAQTIVFDGGSGSAFAQVQEHQTVWVGTAAGLRDKGKVRIKSISSGDAGVTGTLVVGGNGIDWDDDNYLTFLHDYELWAAFNRVETGDIYYKDWDADGGITYTDENTNIPPVCIAGPNQVGFLSGGTIQFSIPIGDSYTMASGATISSKSVTVYPTAGVTVNAESGGIITIDITAAGQYVAKCTVTDSNGTSQVTFRKLFVHSSDPSSADYPLVDMSNITLKGDWPKGGWSSTVRVEDNADASSIPDGNLAILWRRTWYDDIQKDISIFDEGTNILICGYIRRDSIDKHEAGTRGSVSFTITTIESLLSARPLFSIPLEINASPSDWWQYENGLLTAGHIVHYLYRWHSTLLHVTDVLSLNDDDNIDRKAIDFDEGSQYKMGDEFVSKRGIFAHLVCDKSGRFHMARDLALRIDSIRNATPVISTIEDEDTADPVVFIHAPEKRVHFVFYSGLSWDGTTATAIGSTSPSTMPGDEGSRKLPVERQMISDQTYSNRICGQIEAVENNEWPEVRAIFHGDYLGLLEPAIQKWWQMDVASGDTPKNFIWTDKNLLLRQVSTKFDLKAGHMTSSLVFEPEADGTDGVPYQWLGELPTVGGDIEEVLAPGGAGGFAILTGSSIYYLPGGTSTWQLNTSDAVNDVVQDPFWRAATKQNTTDPSQAILMTAEETRIRRSLDAGITFTSPLPGEPPNDAGDSPAPRLVDLSFTEVEGSLVDDGTFVWTARWLNNSGVWRSWLLYTDDDGATFTWQSMGGDVANGIASEIYITGETYVDEIGYAKMTDTRFLTVSQDDIWHSVFLNGISMGELSSIDEDRTSSYSGSDNDVIRLSDTTALVGYRQTGNILKLIVVDITSDVIVRGSELTINNVNSSFALCYGGGFNAAYVVYRSTTPDVQVQRLSISGMTVALNGSSDTLTTDSVVDIDAHHIDDGTWKGLIICYKNLSQSSRPYAQKATFGPFVASPQLELDTTAMDGGAEIQEGRSKVRPISDTSETFVFTWISDTNNAVNLIAIDTSGALSKGSIISPSNNARVPSVDTHGDGFMIATYYETVANEERALTISISGTTITNNNDEFAVDTVSGDAGTAGVISFGGVTAVVIGSYSGSGSVYYYSLAIRTGATQSVKVLGMSLAKGLGTGCYVTSWTGDGELVLSVYVLPSLTLVVEVSLGASSLAQVNSRTWWAHPYAVIGDDFEVVIYGRMNDPGGLGTVHMLYSATAGLIVSVMENGFDADHIGSVCMDAFGTLYPVRNISAASPKVYSASPGSTLTLLSTAGISGGVNPKASNAYWDGNILLGIDTGDAIMVVYSPYPYANWFDITGNHGIADGINSIEVL